MPAGGAPPSSQPRQSRNGSRGRFPPHSFSAIRVGCLRGECDNPCSRRRPLDAAPLRSRSAWPFHRGTSSRWTWHLLASAPLFRPSPTHGTARMSCRQTEDAYTWPSVLALRTGADRGTPCSWLSQTAGSGAPSASPRPLGRGNPRTTLELLLSDENQNPVRPALPCYALRGTSRNPYRAPHAGFPSRKHSVPWCGSSSRGFLSDCPKSASAVGTCFRIRVDRDTLDSRARRGL